LEIYLASREIRTVPLAPPFRAEKQWFNELCLVNCSSALKGGASGTVTTTNQKNNPDAENDFTTAIRHFARRKFFSCLPGNAAPKIAPLSNKAFRVFF